VEFRHKSLQYYGAASLNFINFKIF
jgi:hypothetical protein